MSEISLICVYNDQTQADRMVKSCENQGLDIDFVLLDNREKQYLSAASALKAGAKRAAGEILVFLHQDIEFLESNTLKDILAYLKTHTSAVIGAAGVLKNAGFANNRKVLSNIVHGSTKERASGRADIRKPTEVFTLDECLFAMHKQVLEKICFDPVLCDGWHLYGADLCLQAHLQRIAVLVFPMYLWHRSEGKLDPSYFACLEKLAQKYKTSYKVINTCCASVVTKGKIHRGLLKISDSLKNRIRL